MQSMSNWANTSIIIRTNANSGSPLCAKPKANTSLAHAWSQLRSTEAASTSRQTADQSQSESSSMSSLQRSCSSTRIETRCGNSGKQTEAEMHRLQVWATHWRLTTRVRASRWNGLTRRPLSAVLPRRASSRKRATEEGEAKSWKVRLLS